MDRSTSDVIAESRVVRREAAAVRESLAELNRRVRENHARVVADRIARHRRPPSPTSATRR